MKTEKIQRSPVMVAQELLNNGEIQIHADLKCAGGSGGSGGESSVAAQMIRSVYALYLAFMKEKPEDVRLAYMRSLFKDCGRTLETRKDFIGVFGMDNSSIYASRLFENRNRPTILSVLRVLEHTGITSLQDKQKLCHAFGLHPGEEIFSPASDAVSRKTLAAALQKKRREKISAYFSAIQIPDDFNGTKSAYYARYTALSDARVSKLKGGSQKTNAANAFHCIAALGSESMTPEQKEALYHAFGYHPLEEGEADAVIALCHGYYRKMLALKTGLCLDDQIRLFWALLYVLLDSYDVHFSGVVEKEKSLPDDRKTYPNGYCISLLPQMFYKDDEVDSYYTLYSDQIVSPDSGAARHAVLFPDSADKPGNGKEPK